MPEPGSTLSTARPLTLGTISGGTIDPEDDTDYFSITLSETTHVIVWAAHKYVPHVVDYDGTYREPIDVDGTLLDSNGNPVTANLREEQLNLPMGFYLRDTLAAGTHYLKVVVSGHRANYDRTGPYVLWAEEDTNYGDFLDDCTSITTSYSDPLFGCQWHLDNTGQGEGTSGEDINVTDVWTGGNTGEGIVVAVLDDGVDPDHEDLDVNKDMSHDYLGEDQLVRPHETHGTQVAGIIAARDNSLGMRGVAPGATIYSYNILAEQFTLENAVDALTRNMDKTAVSNNSWGGANAFRYLPRPAFYDLALEAGVSRGYGGKGVFYVFSAGNGAAWWAYSNHDELANHYAVTTVCAVNDQGLRSYYSERGSNLWVCAPSNDDRTFEPDRQEIASTSSYSRYTGNFGGTSAAAPQVSGVAALVRKANSSLTWRDVKLLLAASARKTDPTNDGWDDNPSSGWHDGALKYGSTTERYSYSHHYGFGVVDAKAAVGLAENWTNLPSMKIARGESGPVSLTIPDTATTDEPSSMTSTITMDSYVEFVEFVEVNVDFTHDSYRDLEIELVSPSGAVSILSVPRDQYKDFEWDGSFRFGSARHLGEAAAGTWTLRLKDWINGSAGTLRSWNIRIIGHGTLPGVPALESVTSDGTTLTVSWAAPDDIGSSDITEYELRYIKTSASDKSDSNWTVEDAWTSGDLEYTVSGLESGVSYDIQMRAVSSAGDGRWSDTVQATGSQTPTAPVIATVVADGHRTLKVVWSAPVYHGSSEITAYDVRYIPSSWDDKPDHRWYVVDDAWTSGSLEHWVSGISSFREHDLQVRAVNAAGEGPWSGTRTGEPLRIGPSVPGFAGSPAAGDQTITITWTEPQYAGISPVIAYDIRYISNEDYSTDRSNWTLVEDAWTGGPLSYTISGLGGGLRYVIEMRAVNSHSDGDWTGPTAATPYGPPGSPTIASIEGGNRSLLLTWSPPSNNGGRTITSYDLRYIESDATDKSDSHWTIRQRMHTSGSYEYNLDELTNNTEYDVQIRAVNASGGGTWSATETGTPTDPMTNLGPSFVDGSRTRRSVPENSAAGTAVGEPVQATDLNDDTLTYEISSQQGGPYTVDSATGQIRVGDGATLDHERNTTQRVNLKVEDPDGLSDTIQVQIEIADVNEPPVISGNAAVEWRENRTGNVTRYTATDPERDSVEWSVSGTDAGFFSIDSSGYLTFNDPPDFEASRGNTYAITVVATDTAGNSGELGVAVTVTDVNEPPTVEGRTELALSENDELFGETYSATDPEGSATTFIWSVWGTDGGDFTINRDTGVLTFRNTPDYERPADSNRNNEYLVQVRASDGQYTGALDVTVTVTPVNEPPTLTGTQTLSYAENSVRAVATYRATDPEGATITWSVSGTDDDDFDISETGVLTFAGIPDFEVPDDADQDNEYLVAVVAEDDDSNTAILNVTVTVTNSTGAEEPTITTTSNPSPYRENGTGAVYTFRARDPQGRAVTWSVTGTDSDDFQISAGGVLTFINSPDFENPADADRDNVYEITVVVADDQNLTDSVDVAITVTNHNEGVEPTISTRSPPSTYRENGTSTVYTFRASDPQRQDITWTLEGADSGDLNISSAGALVFINPPNFEAPVDNDAQNDYELTVIATDEDSHADRLSFTITVTDVNEGPEVTGGGDTFTVQENRNWSGATFAASDPEGGSVTRWSLGGTDGGDFTITNTGQITFRNTPDFERPDDADRDNTYEVEIRPYDGRYYGSHHVTITVEDLGEITGPSTLDRAENFSGTLATYAASGRGDLTVDPTWRLTGTDRGDFSISEQGEVMFRSTPDHDRPADSNRDNEYLFAVQASDGRYYDSRDVTVTVTPVNEAPTITTASSSATALRQNENRTSRLYTYRATDPEGSATITWSVGGVDGRFFAINERGEFSFDENNPPDYEIPGDAGGDNVYDVTIQARDDGGNTASLAVTVTVREVNEGPEVTSGQASFIISENQDLPGAVYSAFDPEGGTVTRWSLGGRDGGDFTISSGGVLTFRTLPDYERPEDSNRDNVYELEVRPYDGRYYGSFGVMVAVNDVNEPPTITTTSTSTTTLRQPENRTTRLYTYRATDPEGETITWLVGGVDGRFFAIDERGQFSFSESNPPDYEIPGDLGGDNVYDVLVQARDAGGITATLPVAVTVTDVNEGPEVSGTSSFTIAENRSLSGAVYSARDPEGAYVTRWSLGGRDGGDFFITQGGTLYFRSPPDYERPADSNQDNVYEVSIQPYDGRNTGSYAVTVTVTDVNEPPEIQSGSTTYFTQPENRATRLYTYSATDPEGGTVTWSVAGTDGNLFAIDDRGQFSFREDSPPDFDAPGDVGRDNLYYVTIQVRDPQFNTRSLPVIVVVTEVNEGPVITRQGSLSGSPPGSVPENHPVTQALATYTASDPERPSVRITQWSTSGRDGGDFVMNALGELRFRNSPDYEGPADSNRDNVYEVTIRASDGGNTSTLEEVQVVTVSDVNEPPTITTTSRTAFTQPENRNTVLYTFRATDPERGTVSWSPAGTDGRFFTIDEQGRLSFTNPPDFESPSDLGRDNVYNVTVQARDDDFNTASLEVVVTVTNHNEGVQPTISTRRPPTTYQENRTTTVYTFRASDPQRGVITWSLQGTDAGDFTISESGVLTFSSTPDFENPDDADRDNAYELTVVATDEEVYTDRVDFTITVTNHNEGVEPTISTRRPPSTYQENRTTTIYTFRASDPQRQTITWSLTGTDRGAFTITTDTSGRGVLAFLNPPDFENPVDSDRDNAYQLAVVATDDDGNRDRVDFTITVTDVNEVPTIMVEGTATTTVPENYADTAVLARYTARDPENPGTGIYQWSTAGRDGGDFVINALGELRFRAAPDFERPADSNRDNVYEVIVRASDGQSYGMLANPLTVTVTNLNEVPVITTRSRTEFTTRENSTSIVYTYRATDQDVSDVIRWSVEGTDGGDFAIYNGMLTFRLLPDLEAPVDANRDNVYEVTVVASDTAGLRDTIDATITVTDQSEGPVIAGTTSFTVEENYDINLSLGTYTATDAKDGRRVYPQWSLSGRDGGDFVIDRYSGVLSFRNTPDYDGPADSDRDNIYELTVRGHDSRAYGYLNVVVTVTNINEGAPVVTGRASHTVRENTTATIYTYRATDPDLGDTIAWSTGGDDGGDFVITRDSSGRGLLAFAVPPDFERPQDADGDNIYDLEVVATDGAGLRGTLAVTVTVTALNEGPVVSGTAAFTINENQDLTGAVYTATDPEAILGVTTTITWSLSGRDGGDFTIDRDTGTLTFRTLPNHERPADSNRDNVYELTVRAYDGQNYGTFDVTVMVLAVNEGPEITGRMPSPTGRTAPQPSTPTAPPIRRGMPSPGTWAAWTPATLPSPRTAAAGAS